MYFYIINLTSHTRADAHTHAHTHTHTHTSNMLDCIKVVHNHTCTLRAHISHMSCLQVVCKFPTSIVLFCIYVD